jgi:hypothetical protein
MPAGLSTKFPASFFVVESIRRERKLRELSADLRSDLVVKDRQVGRLFLEPHIGAALGEASFPDICEIKELSRKCLLPRSRLQSFSAVLLLAAQPR